MGFAWTRTCMLGKPNTRLQERGKEHTGEVSEEMTPQRQERSAVTVRLGEC